MQYIGRSCLTGFLQVFYAFLSSLSPAPLRRSYKTGDEGDICICSEETMRLVSNVSIPLQARKSACDFPVRLLVFPREAERGSIWETDKGDSNYFDAELGFSCVEVFFGFFSSSFSFICVFSTIFYLQVIYHRCQLSLRLNCFQNFTCKI